MWLTCHWQGCLKSRPSLDALPTASLVPRPICTPFFLSARVISAARSMTDRMLLELCLPRGSVRLISQQVTPPQVTPPQRVSVLCRPSSAQTCQVGFCGVRVGLWADAVPQTAEC